MDRAELLLTADLALIELDDSRMERFSASVDELLDHFTAMSSIDVDGLEPTTHALSPQNRLRPDAASPESDIADRILEQASDLEDRLISIPNVL